MKRGLLFIGFIMMGLFSQAQNVQLSVHLKNGDIISGLSELETIRFSTDYGNLNFPIDQVSSIKIGLKDNRFDKANLLQLLSQIESGSTKDKEKAFDEIIQMDEGAIPFIKAYLNSSTNANSTNDKDISVQTLYEVMLAKYKVARNYSLYDVLTYKDEFNVEGTYDFTELLLDTDYGLLKVARKDIAQIDVLLISDDMLTKNNFKLYANQHISGNKDEGWLNTGILVKKGDKISINASGQIILASLSGNTYTPDGGVNGLLGVESNKTSYGQVVFKIGQGGFENKVGDQVSTYASNTGILYLSIFESVFNSANTGFYSVSVQVN